MSGLDTENGNGQKTILGVPCKGCTERAKIMGAGNWQVDAIILGSVILLVGIIIYMQYGKDGQ